MCTLPDILIYLVVTQGETQTPRKKRVWVPFIFLSDLSFFLGEGIFVILSLYITLLGRVVKYRRMGDPPPPPYGWGGGGAVVIVHCTDVLQL